ncbi:MAG: (2Fe-2S)-binding protein [Actinomycetota bacterium]|nr:(2Fe-2S)-binding protein [Actinomycetota bacterium]
MSEIDRAIGRITAAQADGYGIIVRRRDGPGDGWFSVAELDGSGRVEATLMSRISGMSGPPEAHISAEWMVESLARALADLAGSFAVTTRTLPDLAPDNVLLAAEGGLFRATAVISDELFEGEPEALADRFRTGFTDLMRPTIEWTDSQGLRPAKTLWRAAADRLAQALVWSGKAFDRPDFALELTRLVVGPDSPDERLRIPVERAEDEYGDEFHLRATCCLAYRTPDGYTCQSCPLQKTRGA